MKVLAAVIASAVAAMSAAAASAQTPAAGAWWSPSGLYGTLGYSNVQAAEGPAADLSGVEGRLGARFGRYLGVEGEATAGFGRDDGAFHGDAITEKLNDQYAGYLVGFLPVAPRLELLARVGYGGQDYHVRDAVLDSSFVNHYDSVNYGAGAQYALDPKDGVRVDYTRYDAQGANQTDSNVFAVSFVRRF